MDGSDAQKIGPETRLPNTKSCYKIQEIPSRGCHFFSILNLDLDFCFDFDSGIVGFGQTCILKYNIIHFQGWTRI